MPPMSVLVGAQVMFQHPFGTGHAVRSGESVSAAGLLLANDRAAGFGDRVEAAAGEVGDQAGLARDPRPPVTTKKWSLMRHPRV